LGYISFDEETVLQKLRKLRDDKAAGADELVPRFLNLIKQELACPLTMLFRTIMESESVPDDWKVANVVPVHKGGSRNVATNYRSISLTSQLYKIFETLVRDQVIELLESNQLIKDSQHGFRKGSSCLTNLLTFLDKVLHSVNEGYPVDVVFLNLAKGKLLSVTGDWLSNRKQRVCIKGRWSSWISVCSGVPQGVCIRTSVVLDIYQRFG